jgi:Beta-lactamase
MFGRFLLGQIIEALTTQSYEVACAERVLMVAGAGNPKLDATWGGIMQAASGWSLSGPEYLALIRLLHVRPRNLLSSEVIRFLCVPDGNWMNAGRTMAYTLGVVLEPVRNQGPTFLHSGGHNWYQEDAAGGAIHEARGTSFVLADNGVGWFASYDGLSAGTDPNATGALRKALDEACQQICPWPDINNFTDMGVGSVLPLTFSKKAVIDSRVSRHYPFYSVSTLMSGFCRCRRKSIFRQVDQISPRRPRVQRAAS